MQELILKREADHACADNQKNQCPFLPVGYVQKEVKTGFLGAISDRMLGQASVTEAWERTSQAESPRKRVPDRDRTLTPLSPKS